MTLGANLHADVLLGGTGRNHIATGAPDRGLLIVGVDAFLHYVHLFLHGGSFRKRIRYNSIVFLEKQLFF